MKAAIRQPKGRASGIGRRFAVVLLLLTVGFGFMFHACELHLLLPLEVPTQVTGDAWLPTPALHSAYAPRLNTVTSRFAPWATVITPTVPISLLSLARGVESHGERRVPAVLADSGLEVRAPPQGHSS